VAAPDGGAFRISDVERDQVSEVLSEHAGEGRLTMDELDQRLGVLNDSETRAQVAALVADLPPLAAPALPEWLSSGPLVQAPQPAPLVPPHEDRAAMRKRAKLRQDENAIGHTFQAVRRTINAELPKTAAPEEQQRLRERLRQAQDFADAARAAVTAGNRAEVQQQLARLRGLRS
jgi:Domain of unknown function (DUF1707)